jgi:hypothetical protein
MNTFRKSISFLGILLSLLLVSANAEGQNRNTREVRDSIRALNTNLDNFEYELRYQIQNGTQDAGTLAEDIAKLRDDIRAFQDNLDRRRENRQDAEQIIYSARQIDDYVREKNLSTRSRNSWESVRRQVERLVSNYGVTANWDNEDVPQGVPDRNDQQPIGAGTTLSVGLSGTYDLDVRASESVEDIISRTSASGTNREDLREKLEAPGQIAIDIRGNQVTLATTKASPVSFVADGRDRVEQSGGRTIRLRATLTGNTLTVSSIGGETDYKVTFTSQGNGQRLNVSRQITTPYLNQTVWAESTYNKTDSIARLGIDRGGYNNSTSGGYSDNDQGGYGNPPVAVPGRTGDYIVSDGVIITGYLENAIDTSISQNNDRFRLTVQSPDEFRGATIEGYLTGVGRSGKVTGRSNVTLNFQSITLRDGKTYDFAGTLTGVRDAQGKVVRVDTEGVAKGDSQTKETAKRGGIGAGLGAVIGAIAGGGKGAAIGAIIGGSAGAGSVIFTGRDDVRLDKGAMLTIQASSPIRGGRR